MNGWIRQKAFFLTWLLFLTPGMTAEEGGSPAVLLQGNTPVLLLPKGLTRYIQAKFPGFRVPTKEDLTGEWVTYRGKSMVPYACWGDFNGDGRTDMALMLLGRGLWRLVAFHQVAKDTYVALELDGFPGSDDNFVKYHPPQAFRLFTLNAGEKLKVGKKLIEATHYKFDSIAFFFIADPESGKLYEWSSALDSRHEAYRRHGFYSAAAWGAFTD